MQLPVGEIDANPDQPRRRFDDASMAELAESIAARGLLQPIVVRPRGGRYQIVAGERRWRAAQRAGLHEIPVVIKRKICRIRRPSSWRSSRTSSGRISTRSRRRPATSG